MEEETREVVLRKFRLIDECVECRKWTSELLQVKYRDKAKGIVGLYQCSKCGYIQRMVQTAPAFVAWYKLAILGMKEEKVAEEILSYPVVNVH